MVRTAQWAEMASLNQTRFWRRVDKSGTCWTWIGGYTGPKRHKRGYWRHSLKRGVLAHRYSYFLSFGIPPDGTEICHRCDNGLCVNPSHLFAATHTANMRDAALKGRLDHRKGAFLPGSSHPMAKIHEEDAANIRKEYAAGALQHDLAERYGIARVTISHIVRGRLWKSIRGEHCPTCRCRQ